MLRHLKLKMLQKEVIDYEKLLEKYKAIGTKAGVDLMGHDSRIATRF